jgi:hypothetical protein
MWEGVFLVGFSGELGGSVSLASDGGGEGESGKRRRRAAEEEVGLVIRAWVGIR